jgi:putative ABC transport system permease protein
MMPSLTAPPTLLLRLYAAALWLYPRRHRRRFAAELLLLLEEDWHARRLTGAVPAWAFWGRAYRDVLFNALLTRTTRAGIRERKPRALAAPRQPDENRSPAHRLEVLVINTLQDIRYALRMIRRTPGFAAAVVLTLTLGIGANAAIFSVINGVVLQPLPYPAADRLVDVWTQFPEQNIDKFVVSRAEFHDYRAESSLFEEMFAYQVQNMTLTGVGTPQRVRAGVASAGIWEVLGGRAEQGRLFGAEEDRPGNDQVIVLDHGFWQQTFGADPAVIGTTVTLDGFPFQVLGVVAPGFQLPDTGADFYTPLAIDPAALSERSGHGLTVIGRTRSGVTLDDVLAEMAVVSARWQEQYDHAHPFTANRLADEVIGDARRPLWLLAGAVGFVLLIACANVAGLLMARTSGRQREIAVRAALGARRGRLVRQILTEGVVLAGAGGALGFALAAWGTGALLRLEPGNLPRLQEISSDTTVAAFVALVSLLCGLALAAVPAWRASGAGTDLARAAGVRSTAGRGHSGFQRLMVTVELAVAIVLVIGSGLLVRSFARVVNVDPGLVPDQLVATRIALPPGSYEEVSEAQAFWDRLRDELEATPGVRETAFVRALPVRDQAYVEVFLREGETLEEAQASGEAPSFDWQMASAGYFHALGIPLVSGREFTAADREGAPRVAVISESVAQRYFPGRDPVGERIRITAARPDNIPFEIIGVAGDVHHDGLASAPPTQIFTPYAQAPDYWPQMLWTAAVAIRTDLAPEAAAAALRRAVWDIDPELPLARISTMNEVLRAAVARPRFLALLLSLLSALALVLACVGVYGVVAYGVAQRTREMGIRMALGARPRAIVALVMREGTVPAITGIAVGIVVALFVTRLAQSLLFDITPTDPATFAAVTAILGGAALLAAWLPARRATRVDALESLRAE